MTPTADSLRNPLQQHRDVIAVAGLMGIALVVFWPWLFTGQAFYWGDTGLYFQPMLGLLRQEAGQSRIPLWNPYIFCGTPYVGNPQMWVFYPPVLALAFFSAPVYIMVNTVLHLALAGIGVYVWLRRGRCHVGFWAGLTGAVVYMLGGYLVSKTQFPNMAQTLAYVPWALLAAERLVAQPHPARAITLGVVLGLQILAAHPQITLFTLYLVGLYAFWCSATDPDRTPRRLGLSVAHGLFSLTVAIGLSCVQLLPVLQLSHAASRQQLGSHQAVRFHLLPTELTNFFWPYRFGSPMFANWHMPGNFWEKACYVGIVPCLLSVVGIWFLATRRGHRQSDTVWWLFMFGCSALLALGGETIAYPIAFLVLPGLSRFHDPARLLFGAAVAVPVLAAIGLQEILEHWSATAQAGAKRSGRRRTVVTVVVGPLLLCTAVIDLGVYDRAFYPLKPVHEIATMNRDSPFVRALQADPDIMQQRARIVLADPHANRTVLFGYESYQQDDPRLLTHWAQGLMQNTNMPLGILQACGYEPVALKSGLNLRETVESQLPLARPTPHYAALLGQVSGKYLVTFGPRPLVPTPGLTSLITGDWQRQGNSLRIYANHSWQPRARVYNEHARLLPAHDFQASPDLVHMTIPSTARRLLLSDTGYAGWTAFIDGTTVPIGATDYQFRTLDIAPAGTSDRHITFVYQPATFKLGLFLTLLTLAALTAYRAVVGKP